MRPKATGAGFFSRSGSFRPYRLGRMSLNGQTLFWLRNGNITTVSLYKLYVVREIMKMPKVLAAALRAAGTYT